MYKHVLYTRDLEPITVVEVSGFIQGLLEREGQARLHVVEEPLFRPLNEEELEKEICRPLRIVTLYAEPFVYRRIHTIMVFVDDEETALLLKSAFLPGQYRGVQDERKRGFAEGFLTALMRNM